METSNDEGSNLTQTLKATLGWYFKPNLFLLLKIPMFLVMAYFWILYAYNVIIFSLTELFQGGILGPSIFSPPILMFANLFIISNMIYRIPKLWANPTMKTYQQLLLTALYFLGGTILVMVITFLINMINTL